MTRKFTEIKHHVNKPTEYYKCELVRSEPGHVVLRYVSDRAFSSNKWGVTFPPGCITIAFYWEVRPYVFWTIFSPDKELLGYLVHICRDMAISDDSLTYLDMLLDLWFSPNGKYTILDENEVEECLQSGRLTAKDKEYIEESKEKAVHDFAENAEKVKDFTRLLDIPREQTGRT
jgi:predicted RNA-binding protein associated with RNAse of E/G family